MHDEEREQESKGNQDDSRTLGEESDDNGCEDCTNRLSGRALVLEQVNGTEEKKREREYEEDVDVYDRARGQKHRLESDERCKERRSTSAPTESSTNEEGETCRSCPDED